jgi:hypothetical protein
MESMGLVATLVLLLVPAAQDAPGPADPEQASEFEWSRREAQHLFNRAGFGADRADIERAVALGRDAFLAELLATDDYFEEPFYARTKSQKQLRGPEGMAPEDQREMRSMRRRKDRVQLHEFLSWWGERMLEGEEPLRERMTLFWHGHFTSSMDDVKDSFEMIRQNQFFRTHALGSFRDLAHGIARDPAMLEYLDNDVNRKGNPNENFARELMELFTLGEGNYTEEDVKEAARAFTGWTDNGGKFRFKSLRHDDGEKTVLGVTGNLDGDDVIEILLEQDACRRFLAGKLIHYFEGIDPRPARLARYADALGESDYDVAKFLAKLFSDPAFYRGAVVGTRIASPVDYLVGASRRIGVEPPPRLVLLCTGLLGQRLFHPPNVKGWDGGETWITTSSLMQRGNLVGVLLGEVTIDDFLDYDPLEDDELAALMEAGLEAVDDNPRRNLGRLRELKRFSNQTWSARINFTARMKRLEARSDGKITRAMLADLLAIEAPPETRRAMTTLLTRERKAAGLEKNKLLAHPGICEPILRRLAHLILSLPEAQLN